MSLLISYNLHKSSVEIHHSVLQVSLRAVILDASIIVVALLAKLAVRLDNIPLLEIEEGEAKVRIVGS